MLFTSFAFPNFFPDDIVELEKCLVAIVTEESSAAIKGRPSNLPVCSL